MRCKPEKLMYALTMNSAQTPTETHGTPETAPASGGLADSPKGTMMWLVHTKLGSALATAILTAVLGVLGWLTVYLITDTNQDINRVKTDLEADIARVEERITRVEENLRSDISRVEAKIDNLIVSLVASRTPLPASDIVSKASFSGELSHIRP